MSEYQKPSETGKTIKIPAWWALVALSMAAAVFVPIQYANMHAAQPTSAPADAQATPPGAATAAKEEAKSAEAPSVQTVERAQSQPSQTSAEAPAPAKPEAPAAPAPAKAEAEAAAEAPAQSKAVAEPAERQAEQPKAAEPVAEASAPAPAQHVHEAKAAPEIKQPVALPAGTAEIARIENAVFFPIVGKDKQGKSATFDFGVLSTDYTWALGSSTRVQSSGKTIPEGETANRILLPKVRDALSSASGVIGIGLASKGKKAAEEERAAARAKTVTNWVTTAAKPEASVWTLSLGQFEGCKFKAEKDVNFDRPVIFAGVRSVADGANLDEALKDALNSNPNLPGRECFSRFDLVKIR